MIARIESAGLSHPPGGNRRRLQAALVALLCVVVGGTVGLAIIEGWGLWRSFFFTLITITTVGYGDEGISESGRIFTSALLIAGIGVASYTFALVVQSAVSAELSWRRRMKKRINEQRAHTIVCGFGRVGKVVCEELAASQTPFVVVEQSELGFRGAYELGYLVIEGSATEDETLQGAGIRHAKHVAAAVDSAAANIVITLTARELNPEVVIVARADQPSDVGKLRRAGATRIVAPAQSGGLEIAAAILGQKAEPPLPKVGSRSGVALEEILVEEGSSLEGARLGDQGGEWARVAFVGLLRPGEDLQVPPGSRERLLPKDVLVVAGAPSELQKLRERARADSESALD